MNEFVQRYDIAAARFEERVANARRQLPQVVSILASCAAGDSFDPLMVKRAIQDVLGVFTVPILHYGTGRYAPAEFWRREPIAHLIGQCNGRLYPRESLITQTEAAEELGVGKVAVNRQVARGAVKTVPVYCKLERSKPTNHFLIFRTEIPTLRDLTRRAERRPSDERRDGANTPRI